MSKTTKIDSGSYKVNGSDLLISRNDNDKRWFLLRESCCYPIASRQAAIETWQQEIQTCRDQLAALGYKGKK